LHFLLGDIEAEIEAELQGDDRRAAGAGGRYLVEPGIWPNWRSTAR
jgi:hypothetical protein